MRKTKPVRSRPMIETLMLIAVAICMGVAFVRFALVVATVPYSFYADRREANNYPDVSRPTIAERIANSRPFDSWWGGRRIPYRRGGDYLGVISQNTVERTLGCALGVLAEADRGAGVRIDRIIVPANRDALYGDEVGTPMTRADGTEYRSTWGPLTADIVKFSDVTAVEQDYDPVLSAEQATRVAAEAGLSERSERLLFGAPRPDGSGTWILLVRPGDRREYILVPVESSPVGGAL